MQWWFYYYNVDLIYWNDKNIPFRANLHFLAATKKSNITNTFPTEIPTIPVSGSGLGMAIFSILPYLEHS